MISLCLLLFGVFGASHQFPGAGSSLRFDAGLEESCSDDVQDEQVPEFDDNPGTPRGTKFSVLHKMFLPCLVTCGF